MATKKPHILVVDDDEDILKTISAVLKDDYKISVSSNPIETLKIISSKDIDLMLLDIKMPKMDGITLLRKVKESSPLIEVIMLTAVGDIKTAINAMKEGAYDYINKPFDVEELKLSIEKALEKRSILKENLAYKANYESNYCDIIGSSKKMKALFETIEKIAPTDSTVLIVGETGTGKEMIAKAIHKKSKRSSRPFIAVNCAAIPENLFETELFGHEKGSFTGAFEKKIGKFEYASDGTIFLDEIGCLPLPLQAKLLRVLQENEVTRVGGNEPIPINTRLICATNMDLFEMSKKGEFRQDLYYRLNVIPINVPPLRERDDDIVHIFHNFVERFSKKFGKKVVISQDLIDAIKKYNWPGNVRELENTAERIVAMASDKILKAEDFFFGLNKEIFAIEPLNDFIEKEESEYIKKVLVLSDWNQTRAAESLKIDRSTLISKIKKYSIKKDID